ncbi:hypothetical protein GF339_18435, partial [candidate division KSB3 bacterium]|nr:hypothetical protein [candidate division KSB3 bacterium]MBD3326568.1 hypothetical protein [candidate division KSB3 bacterium]
MKMESLAYALRRPNRPWYWYLFLGMFPGLIWLAIRDISLAETMGILSRLRVRSLLILVAVNGVIFFTMTARWRLLLAALGYRIPYLRLIGYRLAGNAVSYFTPGPQFGGEPVQVYLLHRQPTRAHPAVPVETATTAVALDRLLELLVNFSVLLCGITY